MLGGLIDDLVLWVLHKLTSEVFTLVILLAVVDAAIFDHVGGVTGWTSW